MQTLEQLQNKIHCAESGKFIEENIPDNCIDLTVTSPPYDNIRIYKGFTFDFEKIAKQLYRITKEGGMLVWVVGDQVIDGDESGSSFKQALYFKEIGFKLHDTMIYRKAGLVYPEKCRYNQEFEYMFVFVKGDLKKYHLLKDRKNTTEGAFQKGVSKRRADGFIQKVFYDKPRQIPEYGLRGNIWQYHRDYKSWHPAQFPLRLAADHIFSWSDKGDIILDPFAGGGNTLLAAKILKRNFIGIEIAQDYCTLIKQRLKL